MAGKLLITAALIVAATLLASLIGRIWTKRTKDQYARFYVRKGVRYGFAFLAILGAGIIWRPFAGQLGLVVGLASAGLAFALQGPINSLAGGLNIMSGSAFRVGDRIDFGGVSGDVINMTPTRTTLMEIGSSQDGASWIHGRQHTGRIVSIANGVAFTEPIFNYNANFEFTWEEVMIPVPYWDDWRMAATIMTEVAHNIASSIDAQQALGHMVDRFPIAPTDATPQVFVKATDNYLELAARFVVPVRRARGMNDRYTRAVLTRFEESGISVASTTSDITVLHRPNDADVP